MKQQVNAKGYGTLKKFKGIGLAGVLMLFATAAIAGSQTVYGDEVAPVASEHSATFSLTASVDSQTDSTSEAALAEVADDTAAVETPAEASAPVSTTAAPETQEEAASVANTTTATVTHEQTTVSESRASIEVSTKVDTKVKEGDTIDYTFTNLPLGGLNGKDVTIADGTVVGKLELVGKESEPFNNQQNNTRDNNSVEDQQLSAETMANSFKLRVVFNKAAEDVIDLSYKFGYTNQYYTHLLSSVEYAYVTKIAAGGKEVATDEVKVGAYGKESIPQTVVEVASPLNSVESAENGLKLTNGKFAVVLKNSANNPIVEGSIIRVKVDGTALVTLTNKVGDILKQDSQRGYYDDTVVNAHNIILNDREQAIFEVISNDGESIILKSLKGLEKTNKFALELKASYTPSSDEISEDGKKITGINNTELTITDPSGNLVYTTEHDNDTANIYGNSITAEAAFTGKVVVRHVTTDGVVLEEEPARAGKEGESYETSRSNFDGYSYVSSSDNTSGQFTRGTIVVTYTYEKNAPITVPGGNSPHTPTPENPTPEQPTPEEPTKDVPQKPNGYRCYIPVKYTYVAYVPVTYVVSYCPPTYYYVAAGCYPYGSRLSYSSYSYSRYSLRTSYSRSYNYASCFGYSGAYYPAHSYRVNCW